MTIRANHRDVRARQRKSRFLMPGQRESRRLEALYIMTSLAAILMWRSSELTFVNVLMAVFALGLDDFEYGVFALLSSRDMAFFASDLGVMALERIFRGGVIFYAKGRRLEAVHGVARSAFPSARFCEELPLVRILVAIHAFCKRYGRLEISVRMTIAALDGRMFSQQRKFCLRVVKSL